MFRIVRRLGSGHSWRTQGGDDSQGSKVSGGLLAGRTWLYATRTTNCCRHLEGALCFGLPVFSLLVLCLALFTSSDIFFRSSFFFGQLVLFKCLPHPLRGGARQFVSYIFSSFFFSFDLFSFFLCFLPFPYFIECVCRVSRIQYDDMALH